MTKASFEPLPGPRTPTANFLQTTTVSRMVQPALSSYLDPSTTVALDIAPFVSFELFPRGTDLSDLDSSAPLDCLQQAYSGDGGQESFVQYWTDQTSVPSDRASGDTSLQSSASGDPPSQHRFQRSLPLHEYTCPRIEQPSQHSSANSSHDAKDRPRCFDHGCDGRAFSCPENYRRHIREQSGTSNVECTFCYISFSRKSNRDTHLSSGRCKVMRQCSGSYLRDPFGTNEQRRAG